LYKYACRYQTVKRIPESAPNMARVSRSRRLSLIALFTALAVVLNLVLAVPAPYEPFLFYEVWEVPILLAVLILGFLDGATVAVLNTILLEAYRPGALPVAPLYNLAAQLSMFAGVLPVDRAARGRGWEGRKLVPAATAAGASLRTAVMTVVNAIVLPLPYPIGFGSGLFPITQAEVPGLLVPIGIFNFTIALYTIPVAYTLARAVKSRYGRVSVGADELAGSG
jgi:riboflavin transporter FmnP